MKILDSKREEVQRLRELSKQERYSEATKVALDMLDENQDDYMALFELGTILMKEQRKGLAYNILARAAKLYPDEPEVWLAYSQAHSDKPENWGRIEWCLKKAIKLYVRQNKNPAVALANMAMLYYIKGDLEKAESYCDQALTTGKELGYVTTTKGFIHLARGEWSKAWMLYDQLLTRKGGRREQYQYGETELWDGTPGKRLVINGEQGIGDELMYASCIDEAIIDCETVVIDCMPRLEGLFKRSFPEAHVYGQRWDKEVVWTEDHNPDCHIAMASLPRYYRYNDNDFPGKPYLIADIGQKRAVRGLLGNTDKPNIGIAWTGGSNKTRGFLRERTLEELLPILKHDVNWISLEYHDKSEEIEEFYAKYKIPIAYYPWLTGIGLDYDLTAALIDELDLIISVPTSGVQMAGALGKECWVLVPKYTGWIFYREMYPWASSVRVFKNKSIGEIVSELDKWLFNHSQTLKPLSLTG